MANKWMILSSVLGSLKEARTLVKATLVDLWCATSMAKLLPLELSVGEKDVLSQVIQESMAELLKSWIGSNQTWDVGSQLPPQLRRPLHLHYDLPNQAGMAITFVMT